MTAGRMSGFHVVSNGKGRNHNTINTNTTTAMNNFTQICMTYSSG